MIEKDLLQEGASPPWYKEDTTLIITIQPQYHSTTRKYRSLGTPPRPTFQARLLHNQEGINAERGGFRKVASRAFFRRTGRCSHPLGCGAIEPGKSRQSRGCVKTPILARCALIFP